MEKRAKFLVEVKDGGCFFDLNHKGQMAMPDRPYVLEESVSLNIAVSAKRLNILGTLKDNCTDEIFVKYYSSEKDKNKAVAKFLKEKSLNSKLLLENQEDEKPAKAAGNAANNAPAGEEIEKSNQPAGN
jgi:hypothetical protein